MKPVHLLDTSALLAHLLKEPGEDVVEHCLSDTGTVAAHYEYGPFGQTTFLFAMKLLFLILIAAGWFTGKIIASEALLDDKMVEELIDRQIVKTGVLSEIIDANKIEINRDCFTFDDVKNSLRLPKKSGVIIESFGVMRWFILRVRLSSSYEMWIQSEFLALGKARVFAVSIIPFLKGDLRAVLVDPGMWKKWTLNKDGSLTLLEPIPMP